MLYSSTALFPIGLPAELLRTFSSSAGLLYAAFHALGIYVASMPGLYADFLGAVLVNLLSIMQI